MDYTFTDFDSQSAVRESLIPTLKNGTYAHATLVTGVDGVGKKTLARMVAMYLLCTGSKALGPCGECDACRQVLSGNHPDVVFLSPESHLDSKSQGKKAITVEDIRELVRICSRSAYAGGKRVVIIDQAGQMNEPAQNALLKTLEEPEADNVFLLLAQTRTGLLPTIVSRCRPLPLHAWQDADVRRILREKGAREDRIAQSVIDAMGSPGSALELATDEQYWAMREQVMRDFFALEKRSDIARVANTWKDRKDRTAQLLALLEEMIHQLLLVRSGMADASTILAYPESWRHMAKEAPYETFSRLLGAIDNTRTYLRSNVTWQALLERLELQFMEEKTKW